MLMDDVTAREVLKSLRKTAVGKWVLLECDLLGEEAGWEIECQFWYPNEFSWRAYPLFDDRESAAEFSRDLSGHFFTARGVKTEYGWMLDDWEYVESL